MIEQRESPDAELKEAFGVFSEVAERLHGAYQRLQQTAARLDRELAEANAKLSQKVDELENLSGSLAAVLRAIPCGVVVAGEDGTLIMVNPAAERILGVAGSAILGRRAAALTDAIGEPLLLLAEGVAGARERMVRTNDQVRAIDGCVVAVADAGGNRLGLVEVLNDRSEVKALQEEVRRLDRLAELGRVAAIIAHEIRNPLAGIRGFAGMLERRFRESPEGETERRWSLRICEGVERADAIIDSVLFLARPHPLQKKRVPVHEVLLDAYQHVALGNPQGIRGVRVIHDVEPPELMVNGDRTRLSQALVNLIQNGVEAMAGNGRLLLTGRAARGFVEIGVADTGPGLPEELRQQVFEPFFTTKTQGAGLGLALVRQIAELHGGSISVRDNPGGGAAFKLRLPGDATLTEAESA